jgi:hypothetical protein
VQIHLVLSKRDYAQMESWYQGISEKPVMLDSIYDQCYRRDRIRDIMLEECPEGFDARFPGRTKAKIPRKALSAIGPFHEVAADGHEKLGAQALKLGDNIGIPIYTYKDKYTDAVLKANVVRDSRSPGVIGHVYLDFIKERGGERTYYVAF